MLRQSDTERAKLLQRGIRDPRRDGHASNSIIATGYVSFEHLRQTRAAATRLLALTSLLDREAICDHILQGQYLGASDVMVNFKAGVATLRLYCLIHIGMNERMYILHASTCAVLDQSLAYTTRGFGSVTRSVYAYLRAGVPDRGAC